ncbi:lasso peptide biosynthesis B2 protein [Mucilaginibacter sp. RS28]|uniref:Lasso peptide biosynthesis B2 protein n=1 Tax=Mucilaginibacter straminoryzae TaxID=2932774 RepID=A0A9X2B834_9SPHI|nr:lasso peptide biosynthesis B2 protein [Mucilaginibacter straminoryzae]MCJ8209204.1 lasso peptide biosynthesis B2 protein [Mucilaginibacter straminoryzae]
MSNKTAIRQISESLAAFRYKFLRCRFLVNLIEASLLTIGFKGTTALLEFLNSFSKKHTYLHAGDDGDMVIIDRYYNIFYLISLGGRFKGRCLSRSLAMQYALKCYGLRTDLRIGVDIHNGNFFAHAWLERNGIILNDHPINIENYFVLPLDKLNSKMQFV